MKKKLINWMKWQIIEMLLETGLDTCLDPDLFWYIATQGMKE